MTRKMTDEEVRDELREIDEDDDVTVTGWEAEFIESVVYKNGKIPLTQTQYDKCVEIIERYS